MPDIAIGDWSKLGSTIRARRQRLALSQAEAAARANVSRSWLARVEAGHRGAELEQLMRLLDALGLTMVVRESPSDAGLDDQVGREITSRHRERSASRQRAWSTGSGGREDHHG